MFELSSLNEEAAEDVKFSRELNGEGDWKRSIVPESFPVK